MIKLSVLMPVYNAEEHIDEALESVLNQTFSDFELLVLDDGSTDGTSTLYTTTLPLIPELNYLNQHTKKSLIA